MKTEDEKYLRQVFIKLFLELLRWEIREEERKQKPWTHDWLAKFECQLRKWYSRYVKHEDQKFQDKSKGRKHVMLEAIGLKWQLFFVHLPSVSLSWSSCFKSLISCSGWFHLLWWWSILCWLVATKSCGASKQNQNKAYEWGPRPRLFYSFPDCSGISLCWVKQILRQHGMTQSNIKRNEWVELNDLTIGWQKLNPLSHLNAHLHTNAQSKQGPVVKIWTTWH